jgi:nucleoside-diphosphate-sugar epimerase
MIAITGHNGFIGTNLKRVLKERGIPFFGVGRNMLPPQAETLIHLAAYGNHSHQKNVLTTVKVNIEYLSRILDNFQGKVINISTSSVHLPIQTAYSLTKRVGEKLVKEAGGVNVRPYSVFGIGEASHRFIPTVIRCLQTGERLQLATEPRHDWIYVDSFIDLMLKEVEECGSGESFSNLEIVKMLEEISGKVIKFDKVENLRPYDTKDWKCPKINKLLVSLYDGLKLTYERTNPRN